MVGATAGGSGLHPVSSTSRLAACASCWSCSKPGRVTVCYLASPGSPGRRSSSTRRSCGRRCAARSCCSRRAATRAASSSSTTAPSRRSPPIWTSETAREQLEDALARLTADSEGLAAVSDGLARLRSQPDLAWQCYACALLAEAIARGLILVRHAHERANRREQERDDGERRRRSRRRRSSSRRPIVEPSAPPTSAAERDHAPDDEAPRGVHAAEHPVGRDRLDQADRGDVVEDAAEADDQHAER